MINDSVEIKQWISEFNGNETLFISKKDEYTDYYIGAKSIVFGMGLSWGTQYSKIKNGFGYFFRKIEDIDGTNEKVLTINKNLVPCYLGAIDVSRVAKSNRERVEEYKEKFINFIDGETYETDLTIFDSYIESGIEGIHRLVRDVARMDYTLGFERISEIIYELMTNQELTLAELTLSNKIHDIADHLSKNQTKLK